MSPENEKWAGRTGLLGAGHIGTGVANASNVPTPGARIGPVVVKPGSLGGGGLPVASGEAILEPSEGEPTPRFLRNTGKDALQVEGVKIDPGEVVKVENAKQADAALMHSSIAEEDVSAYERSLRAPKTKKGVFASVVVGEPEVPVE